MRSQKKKARTGRKIDFEALAGRVYREFTGHPQKALIMAEQGVALARSLSDVQGEARMTLARAHSLRECGKLPQSLRDYDRAAALFRGQRKTAEAWRTSIGKMDALDQLGRYAEALRLGRRAHRYFRAAGFDLWAAKIEANTGNIYQHLDRYAHALGCYRRAYPILSARQPLDGHILLFNQATTHLCSGQPRNAIELLQSCRSFFEEQGFASFLARTHYNLAYGQYLLGRYQDALNHLEEARTRLVRLRDSSFLASCLLDEAELYLRLNRAEEALRTAGKARRGFERLNMPYELAEAQAITGIALLRMDRVGRAALYLNRARGFFSRRKNRIKSAELDSNLALAFLKRRDYGSALQSLKRAHETFRAFRHHSRMLSTLTYIAGVQRQAGKPAAALATLRRGQAWLKGVSLPWVLLPYHQLRGRLEAELRDANATRSLDRAVRLTESIRSQIPAEDLRISYLQDKLAAFDTLVRILLDADTAQAAASAFRYAERARSQVLLDLLTGALRFDPDARVAASMMTTLSALRGESWRRSIGAPAVERAREDRAETQVLKWMRRSQTASEAMPREQVTADALRRGLSEDQAVVSYYITDDSIHAFLLDRKGLSAFPDLARLSRVAPAWQFLRFHLERAKLDPGAPPDACDRHLLELSRALLDPLLPRLSESRLWTFIPHGPLHAFPFHLLRDREGFFVERHSFSTAPSASVYLHCLRQRPLTGEVLLLGHSDERAPLIRNEIREIRRLYPDAGILADSAADAAGFQKAAAGAGLIHVACHGRFRKDQPFFSGLLLADGWFTLPQIYGLKLNADLVTLSGCETGESDVTAGDELLGLVRGFLYAGAASLLVSLWRVSDESTVFFMREFYGLLSRGIGKSEAWRAAVLRTRQHWPHPYHWAPFLLVGRP